MRLRRLIKPIGITGLVVTLALTFAACSVNVSIPDDYDYDLSEYIKLGKYKGLTYEKLSTSISQADVDDYIQDVLEDNKTTKTVKSGTAKKTSVANIKYVGRINGKKFDGGSGETDLDLDDNDFVDGFADGVIGHKVGETFDVDVTFPDDYSNSDYAGKDAVFTVTINSLTEEVTPEYNDSFVKKNTDYDTTEEYEAAIRKKLKKEKASDNKKEEKLEVFDKIADSSKVIKYPKTELNERYKTIVSANKSEAEENGMTWEQYRTYSLGMTAKDFKSTARSSAKATVKDELIIHAIAEKEGIEVTSSEYSEYLDNLLENAGYTEDSFEDAMGETIEEYAEENSLYMSCLYQKVMNKVMKYSKAQ